MNQLAGTGWLMGDGLQQIERYKPDCEFNQNKKQVLVYKLILLLLMILTWGCSLQKSDQIPEKFQELENITVYSADAKSAKTISFKKDVIYGDTDEVLFGRMGEVAVDHLNRIYITDIRKLVIYALEPDGRLIDLLGGDGRGPGEFSSIQQLQIRGNRLYAFDSWQNNRVSMFNLETLTIEKTISLARNRGEYDELNGFHPSAAELYVGNDDTFYATFISSGNPNISNWEHIEVQGLFFLLDLTGDISGKVMDFTHSVRTIIPYRGVPALEFPLIPFYGKALTVLSSENLIYFAEPDQFMVKAYSPNGSYQRAFYYPLRKIPLTRTSAIEVGVHELGTTNPDLFIDNIGSIDLPENWPVLTDMKIDNENRLWISTIVEDFDIYEWWVLEETGELITRFDWPRDEPIEVIKNGYMYTRKTDEGTDLQQIVRYKIVMEEAS
ncbi:MAG: 6-bladed beta-propeller [Balneolaceae bacterium]|nr:6-bladed beta-propeller [Balneolaceae bacterium]